jgi:hypothetical protein
MTSRRRAAAIAIALAVLVVAALVVQTARATDRQELVAAAAIRAAFGTGETAGCFMAIADRETGGTFNPRAANWRDRHADGSRGSFGLLQIGALWRRPGETVAAFAARMFDPRANARLARRLFDRYGVQPWGSC